MTLNETYEQEFSIPVTVVGVPKNIVLTSEETDTIRMTIRDKGITLAAYMYGDMLKNVKINFKPYAHNNGTGIVTTSELQKIVYQHLVSSSKIVSTKPDKLEYFFNYGANKRIPETIPEGERGRIRGRALPFLQRLLEPGDPGSHQH